MYDLHGTECYFVHRRILGAAVGFVTGGPSAAIAGAIRGGGRKRAPSIETAGAVFNEGIPAHHRASHARGGLASLAAHALHGHIPPFGPEMLPIASTDGCRPPMIMKDGVCFTPSSPAARDVLGGEAVMGQFGAGMIPDAQTRRHLDCLPGMVLGKDEICYNKRDLKNSERLYPKPRAPLLTGGERNCITRASRAAKKIERTTKQLQAMGMLKKPSSTRRKKSTVRMLPPSGPSIINVE